MPRPRKCRKVCCLPDNDGFVPVRGGEELTPIVLNVDEYESIRLIDREGFSQEQCGEYMCIARTTVQQIYAAARKKSIRCFRNTSSSGSMSRPKTLDSARL